MASANPTTAPLSTNNSNSNNSPATTTKKKRPCCFFFKYGTCEPPRGSCRFDHDMADDGTTPCCFGATCRLGHAKRVQELQGATYEERVQYWANHKTTNSGDSPAQRDATLLQSQLEPWSTAKLRERLVQDFACGTFDQWEGVDRNEIMTQLLDCYEKHFQTKNVKARRRILVQPAEHNRVRPELLQAIQNELVKWRQQHGSVNTRPSIQAESYMILRKEDLLVNTTTDGSSTYSSSSPDELLSRKARQAQKKIQQYKELYQLATQALAEVDPEYAASFSALAVTYQFQGSPHIDKQNTGRFYGLALGEFVGGGICVEADFDTVAVCNSHNVLAQVDGRYPHWVDQYTGERYSLIFYSTMNNYQAPTVPYYNGTVVSVEED